MHRLWALPIGGATCLLILVLLLISGPTAQAGRISLVDGCTLDDAIDAANKNKGSDDCGKGSGTIDEIRVPDNISILSRFPTITSNIIIEAWGNRLKLEGDRPAFVIDGGSLELRNITIRFATERTGDFLVITNGHLKLKNVKFIGCTGGIRVENGTLEIEGETYVCGHSRQTINEWFGIFLPTPTPIPTCDRVPNVKVTAFYGAGSGVHCQRVPSRNIGNETVISRGYVDAIDLWGYVEQGVEVCFPQIGATVFLDAETSPRLLSSLESYQSGNMTCASANRPGTVVLVYGRPTRVQAQPVAAQPATGPEASVPVVSQPAVDGCPVRTTGHINFRTQPSLDAEKIGVVLRGSTVGVVSRIWGWYLVNYQGRRGWIGGRYVDNIGNC